MLGDAQLHAASDLLYGKWLAGERLHMLPGDSRPATRAEGYAIQALLEKRSEWPLFGWKIAATSKAGQRHIGVDGPMAGRILRERTVAPGSEVSLKSNLMKVAEIEFAFRMGEDLRPRSAPYDVSEVLAAVRSLHPAIEIPDSRYNDFVTAGEAQLIADNACAHLFMLGEPASANWREIDLSAFPVQAVRARNGVEEHRAGVGSNVLGDPRVALTWIANELSGMGVTLKAGEVVTTGTCMVPIEVLPGDRVTADYGALGTISARFTA